MPLAIRHSPRHCRIQLLEPLPAELQSSLSRIEQTDCELAANPTHTDMNDFSFFDNFKHLYAQLMNAWKRTQAALHMKNPHKQGNKLKISHLPNIKLIRDNIIETYHPTYLIHPNPYCHRKYQNEEGHCFGTVTIGISPLKDKIYISEIKVNEDQQRQGFGLAILKSLHEEFNSPLVAIHELYSAKDFWNSARELSGELFIVHPEIHGADDIALEKKRIEAELRSKL